jgi:hypothetical protein
MFWGQDEIGGWSERIGPVKKIETRVKSEWRREERDSREVEAVVPEQRSKRVPRHMRKMSGVPTK